MAKRHQSLVALSHDHHHALALALRLRQGDKALLNDGWTHDRKAQALVVQKFYHDELSVHFRLEEEILFPAMLKDLPHFSSLIPSLIAQHRQIEDLIRRMWTTSLTELAQLLTDLGIVLEQHIRKEERELFPVYEKEMPHSVADRIGEEIRDRQQALLHDARDASAGRTSKAGRIILIAEDETEIRDLLGMMFELEGFPVIRASDGQQALDAVREHRERIALLVTDLGLPKLGGIELIVKARKILPSLNVIAASGFGHQNVRAELLTVGVREFLPKPFSPAELLEVANRLLEGG